MDSRLLQVKKAVLDAIHGLGLLTSEGEPVNLVMLKQSTDRLPDESELPPTHYYGETTLPMIQVTTDSAETLSTTRGTNEKYNVTYPVRVTILARDNMDLTINEDTYAYWRQEIIDLFVGKGLADVPEVHYCDIEPNWMLDPTAFFNNDKFASAVVLRFTERRCALA